MLPKQHAGAFSATLSTISPPLPTMSLSLTASKGIMMHLATYHPLCNDIAKTISMRTGPGNEGEHNSPSSRT
eukprot:s3058_g13.t1